MWSAMPDEPPEDLGTIAVVVFVALLVILVIVGVVLAIAF
jgi:hypothetical protein